MSSDYQLGDTIYIPFTTRAFATGIPTTLAGSPVVTGHRDANITQFTTGITLAADFDGIGGLNMITVVATGANNYVAGETYTLYLSAGTVSTVSVVGEVVGHFTLDMSAAAKDLANATDGLGAIKAETALIVEDTGTTIPGTITTLQADTDNIQTRLPAALVGGAMDADVSAIQNGAITAAAIATDAVDADALATDAVTEIANGIWALDATGQQTQGTFGQAVGDPGATAKSIWAATVSDAAGVSVSADVIAVKAETALIVADTNELQADDVPGLIATAQSDLDIITDTDGVVLGAAGVNLIWDEAMVETTGAPAITGTFRAGFEWMFALSRNKITQTATLSTLRNDADAADLATSVVSDDATTYTRAEWSV